MCFQKSKQTENPEKAVWLVQSCFEKGQCTKLQQLQLPETGNIQVYPSYKSVTAHGQELHFWSTILSYKIFASRN